MTTAVKTRRLALRFRTVACDGPIVLPGDRPVDVIDAETGELIDNVFAVNVSYEVGETVKAVIHIHLQEQEGVDV